MANKNTVLIPIKTAEAAQTVQYTANNCSAKITAFTATNTGSNIETIDVLINDGSGALLIQKTMKIKAGDTIDILPALLHVLAPNGKILTTASTAGVINIRASGVEIT